MPSEFAPSCQYSFPYRTHENGSQSVNAERESQQNCLLLRSHTSNPIYLVINDVRHHIPGPDTFRRLRFVPSDVTLADQKEVDALPIGEPIPAFALPPSSPKTEIGTGLVPSLLDVNKPTRLQFALVAVGIAAAIFCAMTAPYVLPRSSGLDAAAAEESIASARSALIQVLIATGGFFGLLYTARTFALSRVTLATNALFQIAERYVKAVELTNSKNVRERVAGVYSLSQLAVSTIAEREAIASYFTLMCRTSARMEYAEIRAILESLSQMRKIGYAPTFDLVGAEWASIALEPGIDLSRSRLDNCEVARLSMLASTLRGLDVLCGSFEDIDVRFSSLEGSFFRSCVFKGGAASWSDLSHCNLIDTIFINCDLSNVSFVGSDLAGACFIGCDLRAVNLRNTAAATAIFIGCDLSGSLADRRTSLPPSVDYGLAGVQLDPEAT
jgi:uncharacterized protein YjbI with pentapeptide repeats